MTVRRDGVSPEREAELDEALMETFPASDPPANTVTTGVGHSYTPRIERKNPMTKNQSRPKVAGNVSAQPRLHQRAVEIQSYGTVNHLPLDLEEPVRLEMTAQLNQL